MNGIRRMMMRVTETVVTPPSDPSLVFKLDPSTGINATGNIINSIALEGGLTAYSDGISGAKPTLEMVNGFPVVRNTSSAWLEIPNLTLGYFTFFVVWTNMTTAHQYICEHGLESWTAGNHGGYDFVYNTGNIEVCIQRTNIDTFGDIPDIGGPFGATNVYCHRWGNNAADGNIDYGYFNSTTPVRFSTGRVEEFATKDFAIGGSIGGGGTPMDIAWFECRKNLTDAEVAAKMTELMTTFDTL